jgi:tRNA threonylcarbamoyladenosine biosynthesis protein TsaB
VPTLLLDTASDVLAVGLAEGPELAVGLTDEQHRAQALLALVDEVLERAGQPRSAVERVAVGTGPGGFTGLRVGIATARGLALALGVPLAGVSTLAAMAAPALVDGANHVWASLDARRGERFVQGFTRRDDGVIQATGELLVLPTVEAEQAVGEGPVVVAGPAPRGLAIVAAHAIFGDPRLVLPTYGRAPDATPPRRGVGVAG